VNKKVPKKELGQYPAILTSRLVNNPYVLIEVYNANCSLELETLVVRQVNETFGIFNLHEVMINALVSKLKIPFKNRKDESRT